MPSLEVMRATIPFLQKALHLSREYPPRPDHWQGTLPPVVAGSVVPQTHNVTIEKILVQPNVLAGHLPPP
jgi:hypothetical protein